MRGAGRGGAVRPKLLFYFGTAAIWPAAPRAYRRRPDMVMLAMLFQTWSIILGPTGWQPWLSPGCARLGAPSSREQRG